MKLVEILAYAKEFDEIPLRHNEDNYNEALAKICPYPIPNKAYDSSNLKTFLLF
jgi:activating signal cointegrator complex subunit 3